MLGKAPNQHQLDLFKATLKQIIDPNHPLVILAQAIPCKKIEEKFIYLYSHIGAPSHHLTKMTGLLLLQRIYNLSDERVVTMWREGVFSMGLGDVNPPYWPWLVASALELPIA